MIAVPTSELFRSMTPFENENDWQDCTEPLIAGLVKNFRTQQRLSAAKRVLITSATIFLVAAVALLYWANRTPTRKELREQMVIPVSCKEVLARMPQFTNASLDEAMTRRIRYHIDKCDHCKKKYIAAGDQLYDPLCYLISD